MYVEICTYLQLHLIELYNDLIMNNWEKYAIYLVLFFNICIQLGRYVIYVLCMYINSLCISKDIHF